MRRPLRRWLMPGALMPLLALLFAGAANAETISGTVRDAQTGALRSMVVSVYNEAGALQASATTDNNGRYEITVAPGKYRVLAYDPAGVYATQYNTDAPSFEESPQTVITAGQNATVNFSLIRAGMVSGFVLTSAGVRPGITVAAYNLSGTRRGFTTTNAAGNYTLVLPPGSYKIVAYDDDKLFAPSFFHDRSDFTTADVVTVIAGKTVPGVEMFLQLGARLAGSVTDLTGTPIANASILVYTASGVFVTLGSTDSAGRFALTVPPGSYRLVAIDNSFVHAAGFLSNAPSFEQSQAVTIAAGQARNDLNFKLESGGRVEGTIVDAQTQTPVASMTVAAYNADGSLRTFTTTDANGHFVLLLPSGNFRIAAFDPQQVYATRFFSGENAFDAAVAIGVAPAQTVNVQTLAVSHGGRVTGTITDAGTGTLLSGATVIAYDDAGNRVASTTANSAGSYSLVLPAGSYRLAAFDAQLRYAPGYAGGSTSFDAATRINVVADQSVTSNFALVRAVVLKGTVIDSAQRPLPGILVSALDANGNRTATATTTPEGSFQLPVPQGVYKVVAYDPAGRYVTEFFGGSTFADAVVVDARTTSSPTVNIVMDLPSRRHRAGR